MEKNCRFTAKEKEKISGKSTQYLLKFRFANELSKIVKHKIFNISDERFYKDLKKSLLGTGIKVEVDIKDLANVASLPIDLLVNVIASIAGLETVMHIIESGTKVIGINK